VSKKETSFREKGVKINPKEKIPKVGHPMSDLIFTWVLELFKKMIKKILLEEKERHFMGHQT